MSKTTLQFTHQLPNNSKRFKLAFFSIVVMVILCAAGMVIGEIFWSEYTYPVKSLRTGAVYTGGWPATLYNWSLWLGIAGILCLPMMYFMQDFKNPSMGLTLDSLFLNQQLMRNTLIPYTNIEGIVKEGNSYTILFHDTEMILKQQVKFFKPFVKSNLGKGNFMISSMHTGGKIDELMDELKKRISAV